MNKRKIFNDPVYGFITIPHELIFDLIEHPYFQRLRRIKQLGLSEYIYPGALHTRFHHALGAFHLLRKAIAILQVKGVDISEEETLGASIAVLLHDIGHGPFSHTLEKILIPGVSHEYISRIYLRKLNEEFGRQLDLAISIFEGTYRKKFLNSLVSSQLDVDRLDYLTRDSFYTGVNEGIISYNRIIEMMNVKDGELVIEQKGIYSIEKFIISRRLMYWQVYLHKTVLCVEWMLIRALERAKFLSAHGEILPCSEALNYFLKNQVSINDFENTHEALMYYSELDDTDVMAALKNWKKSPDKVLSYLCNAILNRKLFKIELSKEPLPQSKIDEIRKKVSEVLDMSEEEAAWLVIQDSTYNHAYNPHQEPIKILDSQGNICDAEEVSEHLEASVLSEKIVKYFCCYPKALQSL
ncbi:MAG: HD domain-containing protein [Chitinophagales bacterium]|nr:HD domain-containing protein [Chitinophagales bacterium]